MTSETPISAAISVVMVRSNAAAVRIRGVFFFWVRDWGMVPGHVQLTRTVYVHHVIYDQNTHET